MTGVSCGFRGRRIPGANAFVNAASAAVVVVEAFILAVAVSGCTGCVDTLFGPGPQTRVEPCRRLEIPPFVVGANVIDLSDHKDDDPKNDGQRGYGSDKARETLDDLKALGVNGVVLPVTVHTSDVSSTVVGPGPLASPRGLKRLGRMIDDAHARGLIVTVVPHLMLDDGGWRGDMAPAQSGLSPDDARQRFMLSYAVAIGPILEVAETHCAEAFSAGVEFKSLSVRNDAPALFAPVVELSRSVFKGALTYSANWDEVEESQVWPLLDGIGINAFYPLADDENADAASLNARALEVHRTLEALSARTKKPVWFIETGFKSTPAPWVRPWEWPAEVDAEKLPVDEDAQLLGYRAIEHALRSSTAVSGVFFWAVPSDPDDLKNPWRFEPRQGFSFVNKKAETVVRALATNPPVRGPPAR